MDEHELINEDKYITKRKLEYYEKSKISIFNKYCVSNKIIGKGAFGILKKATRISDDKEVIIKYIKKSKIKKNQLINGLPNEYVILKNLNHPNIIKIYDYDEDDYFYYIIMPYYKNGSLDLIGKILTENVAGWVFSQLFDIIKYLHQNGVVHLDIKPDNILISNINNMNIVLTDFGLAKYQKYTDPGFKHVSGTLPFMSPEMFSLNLYSRKDHNPFGIIKNKLLTF